MMSFASDTERGRSSLTSPIDSRPQVMPDDEPGRDDLIAPMDWFKRIPFDAVATSDRLGWGGVEAARYRASPASEYHPPVITHHWLLLLVRPPEEMTFRC